MNNLDELSDVCLINLSLFVNYLIVIINVLIKHTNHSNSGLFS